MINMTDKLFFWTGIMRDHADFLIMNLSSKEADTIKNAKYFKDGFSELHNSLKEPITPEYINNVLALLTSFIEFKRYILCRLLSCNIELSFAPSFINHMINEALEFYDDLQEYRSPISIDPVQEKIELHKKWLADASGHASTIAATLDPVEELDIAEAKDFANDFNNLFIKADELGKMLERTEQNNGALTYLNEQATAKISDFIYFLSRIRELTMNCKLLGFFKPIMADHMIREEQYYLAHIKGFNGT